MYEGGAEGGRRGGVEGGRKVHLRPVMGYIKKRIVSSSKKESEPPGRPRDCHPWDWSRDKKLGFRRRGQEVGRVRKKSRMKKLGEER